ncbi:MAG: hypothetical protein IPP57_11410 [Candidatus Obscuribacter sp.]|nr:hypothetical protein [Candidatus Obscuribacter sp.]
MILFKATGSMWGATSNRFSEHAFSLKSNRGVALWRDNDPGSVTLINPENKTYLIESIGEYLGDNHYGVEVPIAVEDSKVGPHAALDGHPCLETVFLVKPHAGRGGRRHRGLLAGKEAMLKSFDKSSTSPLKTSEVKSKLLSRATQEPGLGRPRPSPILNWARVLLSQRLPVTGLQI